MPRVTVVSVPKDGTEVPGIPDLTQGINKRTWQNLLYKLSNMASRLLYREYLPLNILAFLLGRVSIMGELSPFGLAFFAAVAQVARERAVGTAIWAVLGVLTGGNYVEASIYSLSILAYYRLADELTRHQRKFLTVPILMFAAMLLSGIVIMFWQQAPLYNYMLVLFDAAMCMVLSTVFVYGVPLVISPSFENRGAKEDVICVITLLAIGAAGLGSLSVWGYSVGNMADSLLVMLLAFGGGAGLGASTGVAVGLVRGLADGNANQAIAFYALAGMLAGVFRGLGKFAVVLGFILGSAVMALFFEKATDLLVILIESVIPAAILLVMPSGQINMWSHSFSDNKGSALSNEQGLSVVTDKLNNIAGIFDDLAGNFGYISTGVREKIREEELARVLSIVGEQVCGKCEKRTTCWERDFYSTYQAVFDMLGLAEVGGLNANTIPAVLKDKCIYRRELIETIILAAERNRVYSFWQKKIADSRRMLTEQMKATATIISNLANEINKEPRSDSEMAERLTEQAALLECPVSRAKVTGKGDEVGVEICKEPCLGTRECIHTILPLTANLMQEKMTLHAECGSISLNKKCKLTMEAASRYGIQTGTACIAKEEGISGDTCSVVSLDKGKVAMLLSDGMGCGSQAADQSRMAVHFLEKLLGVGFDVDVAVKTVNSMLMLRMPQETFATVDMAIIDNYSGLAEFLKIGSAPSFIKRVREVSTIKSASLPMGILHQMEIEPIKVQLVPGDIIVMVSDGIIDAAIKGLNKEDWLANFLRRTVAFHPQEIADRILKQAMDLSGGTVRDDMTVLVAKIMEQPALIQ